MTATDDDFEGVRTHDPGSWSFGPEDRFTLPWRADTDCPRCDKPCKMDVDLWDTAINPGEEFDVMCWSCGIIFVVSYELLPEYTAYVKGAETMCRCGRPWSGGCLECSDPAAVTAEGYV